MLNIAVVGLGLIGVSIILAARDFIQDIHITGFDISPAVCNYVNQQDILDKKITDLKTAVSHADIIILSVPVGMMGGCAEQILPLMKETAILTDAGSSKKSVIEQIAPLLQDNQIFIPAHPVSGTEYSGPQAGFATLFQKRWCLLTPLNNTPDWALVKISKFWSDLGCMIDIMSPERHDLVLAITSHIPHLIAFNMVSTADHLEQVSENEVIKYSASGFRDFTRLASSDPTMWRDIFLGNKTALLEMLGRFTENLLHFQRLIRFEQGEEIFKILEGTRNIRQRIIATGQADYYAASGGDNFFKKIGDNNE